MKIVFCYYDLGNKKYTEMAKTSIFSVLCNTVFTPYVLYSGKDHDFISFLNKNHIEWTTASINTISEILSFQHSSSSFWDMDYKKIINLSNIYLLRFEICNYLKDDDFCLYADVDTFFMPGFDGFNFEPTLMAMSKQSNSSADFNSGIIYLNLKEFRKIYGEIIHYCLSDLSWENYPYDQYILNKYYKNKIETLDMSLNWRPHFGLNDFVKIIHFEKNKPFENIDLLSFKHFQGIFNSLRVNS